MRIRLRAVLVLLAASLTAQGSSEPRLVAHEWGTFTSVQGADGKQLAWTPQIGTDLPAFVYSRDKNNGGFRDVQLTYPSSKGSLTAYVRMETPVVYFYSDTARSVDVRVSMSNGLITEWYPQATTVGPHVVLPKSKEEAGRRLPMQPQPLIEWRDVRILSRDTSEVSAGSLILDAVDDATNHYYAARETDANFLASRNGDGRNEYERQLFYRGVGYFRAPLTVRSDASEDSLTLSTDLTEPLVSIFVVTVHDGLMRYQYLDDVPARGAVTVDLDAALFAAASDVRARLMRDVEGALTAQGLYAKEARAMVATWKDQWFTEEGTRVLYLLPSSWTERTLPLDVSPQPSEVVRVMVGRAEVIAPSVERALTKQINDYGGADRKARERIVANTRELGLGRFLAPAVHLAMAKNANARFGQSASELSALVAATPH